MKQNLRILFADDDLTYSLVILRFLRKEGYEVTYAGNGLAALEQFAAVKPDLVLLDINMPGLNGFEVAARIREKDRRTLVFFLTDRSDKPARLKGFDLQGNDYIAKPFYPEELLARIRERFGATSSAQREETHLFGETTFNYSSNELRTASSKTLITSRQADILRLLATRLNTAVSRETILTAVWGDASCANSLALNVQITYLRKALRNDPTVSITSLSRKGYALTSGRPV
jgi:DNA-binding response OmpR family regulator